jgi:DNA repair photolyase
MYPFLDWIWNPIKGECPYHCSYCYVSRMMDRYGKKQNPLHLDERELRTNLGAGNLIFVCSGCDLFHPDVPNEWICKIIDNASLFENKYLWHTKNPERLLKYSAWIPSTDTVCVTIETNRDIKDISGAPDPYERAYIMHNLEIPLMITAEPLIDFDLVEFVEMIMDLNPIQVNIGADSGNNHLPEPSPEKIGALIESLRPFTRVYLKKNLERLYKETT